MSMSPSLILSRLNAICVSLFRTQQCVHCLQNKSSVGVSSSDFTVISATKKKGFLLFHLTLYYFFKVNIFRTLCQFLFPYFCIFFSFLKHIPQVNKQIRQFLLNRLSQQIKKGTHKKEGKARIFCMTFSSFIHFIFYTFYFLYILFCLKYSDFLF